MRRLADKLSAILAGLIALVVLVGIILIVVNTKFPTLEDHRRFGEMSAGRFMDELALKGEVSCVPTYPCVKEGSFGTNNYNTTIPCTLHLVSGEVIPLRCQASSTHGSCYAEAHP